MRTELPEPGFRYTQPWGLIEMRVEDSDDIPIRGSCGHPLSAVAPRSALLLAFLRALVML
jgi:hypothetical protein